MFSNRQIVCSVELKTRAPFNEFYSVNRTINYQSPRLRELEKMN